MNKVLNTALLLIIVGLLAGSFFKQESLLGGVGSNGINVIDGNATNVGATSTPNNNSGEPVKVLARNNGRQYASICNDATTPIYLIFKDFASVQVASSSAATTLSYRLNAANIAGNCYQIRPENLFLGEVWATSTIRSHQVIFYDK